MKFSLKLWATVACPALALALSNGCAPEEPATPDATPASTPATPPPTTPADKKDDMAKPPEDKKAMTPPATPATPPPADTKKADEPKKEDMPK